MKTLNLNKPRAYSLKKTFYILFIFLFVFAISPYHIYSSYDNGCTPPVNTSIFDTPISVQVTNRTINVTLPQALSQVDAKVYYSENNASAPTNRQIWSGKTSTSAPIQFTATVSTSGSYALWLDTGSGNCTPAALFQITAGNTPTPSPTAAPTPTGAACTALNAIGCSTIPCCPQAGLTISCQPATNKCVAGAAAVTLAPTPETAFDVCKTLKDGPEKTACTECFGGDAKGVYTAIGCIPLSPTVFSGTIIRILIILGIGIAFIMLLYGAFLCITSRGNTQQTSACQQTITSAIVGLLLILFAITITRILFDADYGLFEGIVNLR